MFYRPIWEELIKGLWLSIRKELLTISCFDTATLSFFDLPHHRTSGSAYGGYTLCHFCVYNVVFDLP